MPHLCTISQLHVVAAAFLRFVFAKFQIICLLLLAIVSSSHDFEQTQLPTTFSYA